MADECNEISIMIKLTSVSRTAKANRVITNLRRFKPKMSRSDTPICSLTVHAQPLSVISQSEDLSPQVGGRRARLNNANRQSVYLLTTPQAIRSPELPEEQVFISSALA